MEATALNEPLDDARDNGAFVSSVSGSVFSGPLSVPPFSESMEKTLCFDALLADSIESRFKSNLSVDVVGMILFAALFPVTH